MYIADDSTQSTRGFNTSIDFTEILDFPEVEQGMTLDERISIKRIECKVINGRKVSFKITLEVDARVFLNENEDMVREIQGIDDIQVQDINLKMNSLVRSKYCKSICKRKHSNRRHRQFIRNT